MNILIIASLICMMVVGCKPRENDAENTQLTLHEGDIVAKREVGGWSIKKILKIDQEYSILHVALYNSVAKKPTLEDVRQMEPFIMHVPLAMTPERTVGVCLGNIPVTEADLVGYRVYEEAMQKEATDSDSTGSKSASARQRSVFR